MIAVAAAVLVAAAIALPHCLALDRAPAGFASAIWLSALFLRALSSLAVVVAIEVYVPMTGVLGSLVRRRTVEPHARRTPCSRCPPS